MARPIAATGWRSRSSPACRPPSSPALRQSSRSWKPAAQRQGGWAAGLDDLPLFAAAATVEAPKPDPLREAVERAQPDTLSPREALDLLYELKRIAAEAK